MTKSEIEIRVEELRSGFTVDEYYRHNHPFRRLDWLLAGELIEEIKQQYVLEINNAQLTLITPDRWTFGSNLPNESLIENIALAWIAWKEKKNASSDSRTRTKRK